MRLLTIPADANPSFSKLNLSLATTTEEVKEVQRLRYKVFIESMGLSVSNPEGLDKDEFDAYCDHLIVRDSKTLKVVGTYRILGFKCCTRDGTLLLETEFDLSRLQHIRSSVAEAGRACIHPDYRSGAVIMMLWAGLAAYMRRERCSHLIGCASISLTDGGQNAAAIYRSLSAGDFCPLEYRVTPHVPFPLDEIDTSNVVARIPPLLKGYLRAGAWVCGDPAGS
jgi:putative hemolysin